MTCWLIRYLTVFAISLVGMNDCTFCLYLFKTSSDNQSHSLVSTGQSNKSQHDTIHFFHSLQFILFDKLWIYEKDAE